VAWTETFVDWLGEAGGDVTVPVHVKLDTGMGRLGTRDVGAALAVADRVLAAPANIELAGAMTHFATADGDASFVSEQLHAFAPFVQEMRARRGEVVVHAANSAATLIEPASHFDLVRCGIAIYGLDPMNANPADHGLEPALELGSYVAAVKPALAGQTVGYGRRYTTSRETLIGTLPIGYADGVRRAFTNNCDVLVKGRSYPLVGTVSMDNITIELGAGSDVDAGDEATIIGRDGALAQSAEQLAQRIDTINYEIVCGISGRVPRVYHRDGESL
jgi:alanine racemase